MGIDVGTIVAERFHIRERMMRGTVYEPCEMSFRLRRRQYIAATNDMLTDVARIVEMMAGGNPSQDVTTDI